MPDYELESREWWVERWLALLDSYRFKKRLERARKYANEGNVLGIEFSGARVLARVKGSEPEPYQVSLSLSPFSNEDWGFIVETLSEKAIYSAQLLAGEMPANIEEVFTANGLNLFPFSLADIHSRCTCPDKANPCKHIGAVYYDLADRFSEDPFVLFQLRGRTKEQLLETLRQLRGKGIKNRRDGTAKKKQVATKQVTKTPLTLAGFWDYSEPLASSLVAIAPSPDAKSILEILGNLPLPAPEAAMIKQYLEIAYREASQQAIATALNREE
ncbi:MAG: SWIM zinc finger family protein [Cyanobacteria bacterium SBLK]|nr:SWIM zinc finger family protein [Cyanobacteria bacterium SBLK]